VRLLLDTHTLLWWLDGEPALSPTAQAAIADEASEIFVSAASSWEIATKYRLGKLPGAATVATGVAACLAAQGFTELPITVAEGQKAGSLASTHRDPFDRMLVAQAIVNDLVLVSNESVFDQFGASRLW
jgi:PIN domain nuclease of toxin-antitoxin system